MRDPSSSLRVASWNVDSIRARLELVSAWLIENNVDVLCLQEIKCVPEKFPRSAFADMGYDSVVHSAAARTTDAGRGGVAIVSRAELDEVTLGIPGAVAPLHEPRSISASVGGLRLHTLYAPNGRKVGLPSHAIKLAWFELFGSWLSIDGLGTRPTLVMGDLNIAPTDLDVWEPKRYRKRNLTSPIERAAFDALLDRGLVDVVRNRFGDEHVFTWWNRRSDFYASDRGWRLDHVLADPETAETINHLSVDRHERGKPGASDHAPLLIQVRST